MGNIFFWIAFVVVFVIIGIGVARASHSSYRFGEEMFKNSEENLEKKEDFEDRDYYNEDGLFK
jgi:uncharacterized protein (UPF0303 family)